jgi:hypothetical protein
MEIKNAAMGHYVGCAVRPVKHAEPTRGGIMVTLDCGHVQHKGSWPTSPTALPCLESPCYRPVREFAA